jgi:hypothetical protein
MINLIALLLTQKQLNYRDWRKAIMLKKTTTEYSRSINTEIFNKILDIKQNMNEFRTNYDGYIISSDMISKF